MTVIILLWINNLYAARIYKRTNKEYCNIVVYFIDVRLEGNRKGQDDKEFRPASFVSV